MDLPPVDLRSDTVTRPTPAMRAAMAAAEVGDDVYGEDPTVHALEARVAAILGKEAALFVTSGTLGNQLGIQLWTLPGDEVLAGEGAHCGWYETGAAAAIAGVQIVYLPGDGTFDGAALAEHVRARADWNPRTSLVTVENTHNRGGGRVFPQARVLAVATEAKRLGLALHLDGARLWNAAVASGLSPHELAAPFDSVSVCLSKGLGAPVGSVLAGSREAMARARRARKRMGGGMRQAGILAAAGLHALEHHRERLADDHRRARELHAALAGLAPDCVHDAPETNLVMLDLPASRPDAVQVCEALRGRGVLASPFGPRRVRFVFHLDVTDDGLARTVDALRAVLG